MPTIKFHDADGNEYDTGIEEPNDPDFDPPAISEPEPDSIKVHGRRFDSKVFSRGDTEAEASFIGRINEWLNKNPKYGVLDQQGNHVWVARKNDEGADL